MSPKIRRLAWGLRPGGTLTDSTSGGVDSGESSSQNLGLSAGISGELVISGF